MMRILIFNPKIITLLILLSLSPLLPQGKNPVRVNDVTGTNSSAAPWLRKARSPRYQGCRGQPWICRDDDFPRIRRRCCLDRCVDVQSDVNHCGLCGIRCPFTWQCCRGLCVNTNVNPFHCGQCDRRCPFLTFCFYGMCGYAQPLPPFPFPPKPPFPFPPKPPFPFPPKPYPPYPPKPYPPRPPFPFPPKPYPPYPPQN